MTPYNILHVNLVYCNRSSMCCSIIHANKYTTSITSYIQQHSDIPTVKNAQNTWAKKNSYLHGHIWFLISCVTAYTLTFDVSVGANSTKFISPTYRTTFQQTGNNVKNYQILVARWSCHYIIPKAIIEANIYNQQRLTCDINALEIIF